MAENSEGWANTVCAGTRCCAQHLDRAMPRVSTFCALQVCPSLQDCHRTVSAVEASVLTGRARRASVASAFARSKTSAVGGRFMAVQRAEGAVCWG